MVSNQALTRSPGALSGLLTGLAVLTLATGCQTTSQTATAATEPAQTASPVATSPAAAQTAVEAAISREGTQGAVVAAPEPAPRVELNPGAPSSYTVQRGDTLWGIATLFLRDPWLWPEIWHVNPNVQNPHLIYPGDVLALAYGADGTPRVTVAQGSALRVQPLVRSSDLDSNAIPGIRYEAIAAFLGKPSIITKNDLKDAARVAALRDRHLLGGAGSDLFVKGLRDKGPGRYTIVRIGDEVKDPATGKVHGYMGVYAGVAQVAEVGELSRAVVLDSAREMAAGDVVLAEDTAVVVSDIVPRPPAQQVNGQIMAVVDGVSLIGQFQVVALNRGTDHGLNIGHVLAVDVAGGKVRDGTCRRSGLAQCKGQLQLPDDRAGSILVFKTYEQMSYGLILEATVPVGIADKVRTP